MHRVLVDLACTGSAGHKVYVLFRMFGAEIMGQTLKKQLSDYASLSDVQTPQIKGILC